MRLRLGFFGLFFVIGCATATGGKVKQPSPVGKKAPIPKAEVSTKTATVSTATVSAQRKQQTAAALKLVEEGRAIQRERGEGGAEDAIKLYKKAFSLDNQCGAALWELGWSHQVINQWDEVIAAWTKLKEIDANYPELSTHFPVAIMRRDQARALKALPDTKSLPVELEPRAGPKLTLSAVGDIQLGRAWPAERAKLPPDEGQVIFEKIKDKLNTTDITFGNLETVLADDGDSSKCGPRSTACYAFRVPTKYAKTLKSVGFDVLSIANNHTGDFGQHGRTATIEALDKVGILHSGPIGDIASWETKGLKIGLVAFSTGGGVYRVQHVDTARKVVADLSRRHDLVIVSFHGGAEGSKAAHVPHGTERFYGENRGDLRKFTHTVVDAGADLVLGHGPHLLRGMEIYKGRLIAFSLGNFTSWETFNLRGALGITGILGVELAANGVLLSAKIDSVIIEKPGIPMEDENKSAIEILRILSKEDFGKAIFDEEGNYER